MVGRSVQLALVIACGLSPVGSVDGAQPVAPEQIGQAVVDPGSISGRNFAGLRLPLAARRGPLSLEARRAHAWREGDTLRLLLVDDVRIGVDNVRFSCRRAVVWLEQIRRLPDGATEYQVYLYLDHAGSPAGAAFEEEGAIQVSGERLPVRAVLAMKEQPALRVDQVEDAAPSRRSDDGRFVEQGEGQLAASLRRLVPGYVEIDENDPFARLPKPLPAQPPGLQVGSDQGSKPAPFDPVAEARSLLEGTPVERAPDPIFAKSGIVSLSAGKIALVSSEQENAVMATDGVVIEYADRRASEPRTLQIRAQRGVVFAAPGKVTELARLSPSDVRGFYLEGDVIATDGRYTLRGPKIYYDLQRNKAVVLDAVFWTYDERRGLPLYVRAKAIRQESADQFKAEQATFSNTAFFDPEFSIGATSVTIARKTVEPTEEEQRAGAKTVQKTLVDARGISLKAGQVPIFFWPRFSGDPADQPLRDLRIESTPGSGTGLKTRWAVLQLLGLEGPSNLSADLLLDYYAQRGFGVGTRLGWDRPSHRGELLAYSLPSDSGTDVLKSGARIDRDAEFRGMLLGEDRFKLDDQWTAFLETAIITDEAFAQALFPTLTAERREFASRAYARRLEGNTAFSLEASGSLNDFVANEYLLTSKGYSVTRLPEATYYRQADDLSPSERPGLLTWWSEYRVGRVSFAFDERSAAAHGLTSNALAQRGLGIDSTQSPADRLRALGLSEDAVLRADTRQELTLQVREGPFNVQPFAVGRVTLYDEDFASYQPNSGQGNDHSRLWSGVGFRASTTVQRVWDQVDSRILDIHRLRHIIEPGFTYMVAGTNTESTSLPVFDDDVENLIDGQIFRIGLDQTWQTQRGGPGRWHSVDVFKLTTEAVFASNGAASKGPIGRWYEARPELSSPGNFFNADAVWQLSDVFAVTGRGVYDFDLGQQSLSGGGVLIRHSPQFSSYIDAHHVNSQDQTILGAGASYELTRKYALAMGMTYDAAQEGFQGGFIDFRRRFESVIVGAAIYYDDITGDSSLGFSIQPAGARGAASLAGLGGAGSFSRVGGP